MKGWILNVMKINTKCSSHKSFVLTNIIPNPMGASTFSGVPKQILDFIPRRKAPMSLLGMAKMMYQTPLFSIENQHWPC
jgi:hypothetical protein